MPDTATAARSALPSTGALNALTVGVLSILAAMEAQPAGSPALRAYRSALRRKGEEIAAMGVPGGVAVVEAAAITAAPGRAEVRRALLTEAWSDLATDRTAR